MIREDEVAEKQEQKFGDNQFGVTSTDDESQNGNTININTQALLDTAIKSAAGSVTTILLTKHLLKDE